MWAAKLPGEGAALYDAATAMAAFMIALGIAVDGGKDSLSMAARAPDGEMVKAPGALVISLYAPCPDITAVLTPELKGPGAGRGSSLVLIDLAPRAGVRRLGGSALAQVYGQVGSAEEVPDCEDPAALLAAFNAVQELIQPPGRSSSFSGSSSSSSGGVRLLSYHDRGEGGTVVGALEMAFAGDCGLCLAVEGEGGSPMGALAALFSEELGMLVEVEEAGGAVQDYASALAGNAFEKATQGAALCAALAAKGLRASLVGIPTVEKTITCAVGGVLQRLLPTTTTGTGTGSSSASSSSTSVPAPASMPALRAVWESTSFALERRQCAPACVEAEERGMLTRSAPAYVLPEGFPGGLRGGRGRGRQQRQQRASFCSRARPLQSPALL